MPPPKRTVFSLNVDSETDWAHQRIADRSKEGEDRIKVLDTTGPSHGHTDLSVVTEPFEKTVNKVVDDVIQDSGKKVHAVEGDIHYTSEKPATNTSSTSTLSIRSKSKRRALERKYDVSDL